MSASLEPLLRGEIYKKFVYYSELNFSHERIEFELLKLEITEDELTVIRNYFSEEKKKNRHRYGIAMLISGSILLVIGFIVTAILFHQGSPLQGVMYGFTGFGLCLLIIGIYFLF